MKIDLSSDTKSFLKGLVSESDFEGKIKNLLHKILDQQEKMMADLTAEFTQLGVQLDRAVAEINSEIADLAAAIAAGQSAAAVVEDARTKIVAATARISGVADALAADNV